MIDTSAVRNKVLTLAFQGKLTTNNLSDDNVADLYSQICKQRDELIRRKEIKKNKTKAIEDTDIVYEIPVNWIWVRLGEVINLQSGQDLPTVDYNDANKGIPYLTGASNFTLGGSLIINRWTEKPSAYAINGDILLSVKGTVGRLSILHENKVHIARQIMGIRPIGLNRDFVKYFIQAKIEELKSISKGLIPGIERDNVLNMLMPMPPIEEQKRIVSKVDDIYELLDTIDIFQTQYATNVEILKSKLIDAGIRGKLTEQLPEDGNAEDLYNQIQDEKARLIKEGKIKKEKPLPDIAEDEIPFEIPKSWKWVRIGKVINEVIVPQRDKPSFSGDIPWCRIEDKDGIYLNGTKSGQYVSEQTVKEMNLRIFPVGTVLSACSGASIGTILINTVECCTNQTFNGLVCNDLFYNWYLFWFLKSEINRLKSMGSGSAMAYISQDKIRNMLIPLPPIAEQKRIVKEIDALLNVFD